VLILSSSPRDFGSIAKPKVAAAWDVVDGVRLRGSWSQGFRAPNLEQVNTTQYARLGSSQDFYRCQASLDKAGNPTGNIASCGNTAYSILIAGNPNLKPETSTNWTAGIVLQPKFIPSRFGRVTVTADFWSIHQVGIVGQFGPANALVLIAAISSVVKVAMSAVERALISADVMAPIWALPSALI